MEFIAYRILIHEHANVIVYFKNTRKIGIPGHIECAEAMHGPGILLKIFADVRKDEIDILKMKIPIIGK